MVFERGYSTSGVCNDNGNESSWKSRPLSLQDSHMDIDVTKSDFGVKTVEKNKELLKFKVNPGNHRKLWKRLKEYLSSFPPVQFSKWKVFVHCVNERSVGVKNKRASLMMTKQAGPCDSLPQLKQLCLYLLIYWASAYCFHSKSGFIAKEKLLRYYMDETAKGVLAIKQVLPMCIGLV